MEIQYRFDGPILRFGVRGKYTWRDARRVLETAMREPAFREGETALLVDATGSEYEPTHGELVDVARYIAGISERFGGFAVVVTDPLHATLARMLAVLTRFRGIEVDVFASAERAEASLAERPPPRRM